MVCFRTLNLRISAFLLSASFFMSSSVWAVDPRAELSLLIEQKQNVAAFELGEKTFEEWAGDPEFDFLYGVAARKSGNHQKAIFAFERVIVNTPTNLKARIALAIAYYEVDNFKAARREFKQSILLKPRPNVVNQINKYINLMDVKILSKRERLYGSVFALYGYDTNVNSGLGDEQTELPLPGLGLIPFSFGIESDTQTQLRAQLNYDYPMTQTDTITASVAVSDTTYSEFNQFQKTSSDISVSYQGKGDEPNRSYKAMVYFQPFWLAGQHYQNLMGVMLDNVWQLDHSDSLTLSLNASHTDNQLDNLLDLNAGTVRLTYAQRKSVMMHAYSVGFAMERVDSLSIDSQHNERNVMSIGYRNNWFIQRFGMLTSSVDLLHSEHFNDDMRFRQVDNAELSFFEKRKDLTLNIGLSFNMSIAENWIWMTSLRGAFKDSNVVLYDFDKKIATTGVLYKF